MLNDRTINCQKPNPSTPRPSAVGLSQSEFAIKPPDHVRIRRILLGHLAKVRNSLFAALALISVPLAAQDPMELGPYPTREMFPLYLATMVYQPVDPTPLGAGRFRVTLGHVRANTFEFSDVFKDHPPDLPGARNTVTRERAEEVAAAYPSLPVLFYIDEEVVRSSLRVRYGLAGGLDLWAELPFASHTGGYLDSLIEGFHRLGFEQFGRDQIERNQLTVAVMSHGQLQFYTDTRIRGKTQDPTFGATFSLHRGPAWTLSGYASVKPPLTTMYSVFRSGWDHGFGLTARWQPSPRQVFYGGAGFVRRPPGSAAYNTMAFGSMANGWGMHATWEHRRWSRLRPFIQLHAQSGFLPKQPYQKLHRPSLQHDLGFHWQFHRKATATFHYLNNITHNENTADMGLGVSITIDI